MDIKESVVLAQDDGGRTISDLGETGVGQAEQALQDVVYGSVSVLLKETPKSLFQIVPGFTAWCFLETNDYTITDDGSPRLQGSQANT